MKVTVDQDICASSGNCVMNAPEIFDQRDDDGVVVLLNANPPRRTGRRRPAGGGRLPRTSHPHRGMRSVRHTHQHAPPRRSPTSPTTRWPGEPRCPFAPPPEVMAAGRSAGRCPGSGSGTAARRGSSPATSRCATLFSDSRVSVDDRRPGFPHWNEGMLSTVHKRPRSVFTADGEEHTRFRRMLSKPFTFKRVEGLRPAIQQITDDHIDAMLAGPQPGRHRQRAGAAGALAGDQPAAGRALRRRRDVPAPRQRRPRAVCHRPRTPSRAR